MHRFFRKSLSGYVYNIVIKQYKNKKQFDKRGDFKISCSAWQKHERNVLEYYKLHFICTEIRTSIKNTQTFGAALKKNCYCFCDYFS